MINQPEAVYSFTIPYFTSELGETNELFVSELTYEKYLKAQKKEKTMILFGTLHPLDKHLGEVTSTLIDSEKSIIIIGTKDFAEYTAELLDIAIAQELEKILSTNKQDFFRFLYSENTPELIQLFVDDIQQTIEEIPITKQLIKEGYRVLKRELLLANEILEKPFQYEAIKKLSPYENEHGIFLINKLLFLAYINKELFQTYKQQLFPHYPQLLREVDGLLKTIKKENLSHLKGREKALEKIFAALKMKRYLKKIKLTDIDSFQLNVN